MANNLDILNIGNKPTFVNARRSEVIDVTIGTTFVSNYIRKWNVSDEESCSDHRHINFEIGRIQTSILTYQNPRKTNWEAYMVDLETCLDRMDFDIRDCIDLELAADRLQGAIIPTYNEHCPIVNQRSNKNVPWWNEDLARMRKKTRKAFRCARKSGSWDQYRRSLTEYNKVLRKSKKDKWRRQCEEVEQTQACARLYKILSKEPQVSINNTGEYTKTGEVTIRELFWVHFPGSEITNLTPESWTNSELETPKRASREDWQMTKVIDLAKIKWDVSSFQPYKSPGPDGIFQ
ncbi:uncharacterized protein [Leptinotarsa decemlineata]|uniref:uncharacterized protein n=1 Tax=Leptinotarsa decemlineata TaxID=7539 RepID=UPI003D30A771